MNRFSKLFSCLLLLLFIVCYFKDTNPYIKKSNIDGNGLFAGKNYKKGDIIYNNLFPYKNIHEMIYNPIPIEQFNKYILKEGKYINHCRHNKNVSIETDDYKIFPLIAVKDIKKHDELYGDYNKIHNRLPFIKSADPNFIQC
tara:strand:- start:3074 stop:3499 length:426 start_codon:yes stop_codon:yes gene_type:complete